MRTRSLRDILAEDRPISHVVSYGDVRDVEVVVSVLPLGSLRCVREFCGSTASEIPVSSTPLNTKYSAVRYLYRRTRYSLYFEVPVSYQGTDNDVQLLMAYTWYTIRPVPCILCTWHSRETTESIIRTVIRTCSRCFDRKISQDALDMLFSHY